VTIIVEKTKQNQNRETKRMRKQTGSRNRGWLPAIRRRLERYGGHVGNRLSVAAGVALVAGMLVGTAQANLPGYSYKTTINLSPVTPAADFQVQVVLTTANFNYGLCNANGDDLRFTDTSDNLLSYWLETWNPSGSSIIWVKVAASGTSQMWLQYGNGSAAAASSGANTFIFFDDFNRADTADITVEAAWGSAGSDGANKWSIDGNRLKAPNPGSGDPCKLYAKALGTVNSAVSMSAKYYISSDGRAGLSCCMDGTAKQGYCAIVSGGGLGFLNDNRSWGDAIIPSGNTTDGDWYRVDFQVNDPTTKTGDTRKWKVVGSVRPSWSSGSFGTGGARSYGPIGFTGPSSGENGTIYYDDVFLRKYAASEPVATVVPTLVPKDPAYKMKITFTGYAGGKTTLAYFPVLVALSNNVNNSGFKYDNFLSPNGYDLRFFDAMEATRLNYEIEQWNPSGVSYVWVQVPQLPGDGTGVIWAKWGDPANSSQLPCTTNGTTWDGNFKGVWHLRNGTTLSLADATANGNNGTINGGVSASSLQVDGCALFDGSTGYITVPNSASLNQLTTAGTIEMWFNARKLPPGGTSSIPLTRRGVNSGPYWVEDYSGGMCFWWRTAAGTVNEGVGYSVSNTTYFAGTYDGSNVRAYGNGALAGGPKALTGALESPQSSSLTLGKGGWSSPYGSVYTDGYMDEVRLSSTARSADWLWATYQTMASNTVFNSYGTMEKPGPKGTVIMMR
jgi:hypothetical protein